MGFGVGAFLRAAAVGSRWPFLFVGARRVVLVAVIAGVRVKVVGIVDRFLPCLSGEGCDRGWRSQDGRSGGSEQEIFGKGACKAD